MTDQLLDCLEIDPKEKPSYTVIWLHGLGADGHDFEPIVDELRLPADVPVRYVFPHAPTRPVTVNAGMTMRAWYDIVYMDIARDPDIDGVLESAQLLRNLIARELDSGMDSKRIILAGFSQGSVIALHTGLRYELPLAGIMALSTYLPTLDTLEQERAEANANTPIMMAHGKYDPVIPVTLGRQAHKSLEGMGYSVEWHEYPMEHQVCMEEIEDIGAWMSEIVD